MLFYLFLTIIFLSNRSDVDVLFNVLIFLVLPTKNSNSKLNGDANAIKKRPKQHSKIFKYTYIYIYKMKVIILYIHTYVFLRIFLKYFFYNSNHFLIVVFVKLCTSTHEISDLIKIQVVTKNNVDISLKYLISFNSKLTKNIKIFTKKEVQMGKTILKTINTALIETPRL